MTFAFLALLAMAWIAVFLPALLRARQAAPLSTAERFKRRLDLIAPRSGPGRWVIVPESPRRLAQTSFRRAQRRRRRLLVFLLGAAGVSGVAALGAEGGLVEVHLAFDVSLAIYCALLLEAKRRREETVTKVRSLVARRRSRTAEVTFYEPAQAHAPHS